MKIYKRLFNGISDFLQDHKNAADGKFMRNAEIVFLHLRNRAAEKDSDLPDTRTGKKFG